MSWKCPQDANDVPDGVDKCPLCGFVRFPTGVVLKSEVTGKEIQVRLGSVFGHANLKLLGDDEVKFVDSEQFKIEKRQEQGGWALVAVSWAKNPLFLNGAAIDPVGAILKEGDRLSIKDKYFRLTVRLLVS